MATKTTLTEFATISLLFSVLVTELSDEFPLLKPRMLDRLQRLREEPLNAYMIGEIGEAIRRVEGL
jgi:hypothetical protein